MCGAKRMRKVACHRSYAPGSTMIWKLHIHTLAFGRLCVMLKVAAQKKNEEQNHFNVSCVRFDLSRCVRALILHIYPYRKTFTEFVIQTNGNQCVYILFNSKIPIIVEGLLPLKRIYFKLSQKLNNTNTKRRNHSENVKVEEFIRIHA